MTPDQTATKLHVMPDTRDDVLKPMKRDGETWDDLLRRLADYWQRHEGEERAATPDEVRQIVREELNNG